MVIAGKNEHLAPYWGDGTDIKSGLNQLGIRNVAEQLFATLLPGLNNVSLRIRYYSFYCWIISEFYRYRESINSNEFNPFIRRSELLLALINACCDNSIGIPGINFATTMLTKMKSDGNNTDAYNSNIIFSLSEGTDFGNEHKTYWANPGGILRQYYGASLQEIGLIGIHTISSAIYNITNENPWITGKTLADEFANSVEGAGQKFINIVNRKYGSLAELMDLTSSFNMKSLPLLSKERTLLEEVLLQPDFPAIEPFSFHRRNTIKYVLQYLDKYPVRLNGAEFSEYMYKSFSRDNNDLTSWGWYAYYLDDNWQYQMTRIFHEILLLLKNSEMPRMPIKEISNTLSAKVVREFNINPESSLQDVIKTLDKTQFNDPTSESIRDLIEHYKYNIPNISLSRENYNKLGIRSDNFCDFMELVEYRKEYKFHDFVCSLVEEIIFRHYKVSFIKMMQTGIATQKFEFENGHLRFISDWNSTNTSPRIDTLRNFLIDLKLIAVSENKDIVTQEGKNIIR